MFAIIALTLISQQPLVPITEGYASFYTIRSSSRLTASGEAMRDDLKTCAMRVGDFGDYFLVVAQNGEFVVCKLNDRGPYVDGRVIDLSRASMSAFSLDIGVLHVKVYRLGTNPPLDQASTP